MCGVGAAPSELRAGESAPLGDRVGALNFNSEFIQVIAEQRTPLATVFFQLFTVLGEIEGYIFVVAAIYAAFDKRLAFRLAMLALVAMSLNHFLKTIIANPRPFVAEGSFSKHWAVTEEKAVELAAEYSTPSGHAMAGGSFYTFLYASARHRWVKFLAVATLLLTGISRPYLGVHYAEDILLGWPLGIGLALLALRFGERVGELWFRLSTPKQATTVVLTSALVIAGTDPFYVSAPHGQPLPFISYLGLLSGLSVAYPLEIRSLGFDPRSSTALLKVARVALGVVLVMGFLAVLDLLFARIAVDGSLLGNTLRYVRYFGAGFIGMFAAPHLYVWLGWADAAQQRAAAEEPQRVPIDP
jgi:membrane-associated phospholipid phosphatase